ncbi:hypothetical protein HaLaN_00332 [Haematococcus lacustris]|uniref:Uncharacterized protein n=1 Tax=Haematococcus lacustris TaxID=44745 RepID=A0A699YD79_HAELA|nr:hypothetical protein HaLaN_00332 [Haematococcus lacustris]
MGSCLKDYFGRALPYAANQPITQPTLPPHIVPRSSHNHGSMTGVVPLSSQGGRVQHIRQTLPDRSISSQMRAFSLLLVLLAALVIPEAYAQPAEYARQQLSPQQCVQTLLGWDGSVALACCAGGSRCGCTQAPLPSAPHYHASCRPAPQHIIKPLFPLLLGTEQSGACISCPPLHYTGAYGCASNSLPLLHQHPRRLPDLPHLHPSHPQPALQTEASLRSSSTQPPPAQPAASQCGKGPARHAAARQLRWWVAFPGQQGCR